MEPFIKVRYKLSLRWLLALLSVAAAAGQPGNPRCEVYPEETIVAKSEGNNGFAVTINGSPLEYRPEQHYKITLQNILDPDDRVKFQGFMLVVESSGMRWNQANNVPLNDGVHRLGKFHLLPGDSMVKFSQRCANTIEATSSIPKEKIEVWWVAPPRFSGCVRFRAMVEERADVWFTDYGAERSGLTYVLCEDESPQAEPAKIEPCCACDEAKYEAIFQGLWSRQTHPKDFPHDEWRTEFSKIIGASHSINYTLWDYGRIASNALQHLAEHSMTNTLEMQMKRFSPSIRSVIKAHGLQQRTNVAGQTFAVFRVDRDHHLLSLVSKIVPSPDWVVGVSKEDLCQADCTWAENRVIDLYPYDIGTEGGLRYDSPSTPNRPRQPIQRITSSNPNNPESPFYDPTSAQIKPTARLHLIKQRQYHKQCPPGVQRPRPAVSGMNPNWMGGMNGMTGLMGGPGMGAGMGLDYGEGGSYSYPTYGTGIGGPVPGGELDGYGNSVEGNEQNPGYEQEVPQTTTESSFFGLRASSIFGGDDDECAATEWGQWSQCSPECGQGSRHRRRRFKSKESAEGCDRAQLLEKETCQNQQCATQRYGGYMPFPVERNSWSDRGLQSDGLIKGTASYSYNSGDSGANAAYPAMYNGRDTNRGDGQNPRNGGGLDPQYPQYDPPYRSDSADSYRGEEDSYYDDGITESYRASYLYGGKDDQGQDDYPQYSELNAPPRPPQSDDPNYVSLEDFDASQTCQVSAWGHWSDCSSTCDVGTKTRSRHYLNPTSSANCGEELDQSQQCRGTHPDCPIPTSMDARETSPAATGLGYGHITYGGNKMYDKEDAECQTLDWGRWSQCSTSCGPGKMMRTRVYKIPFVDNRSCNGVKLIETQYCEGMDCGGGSQDQASYAYGDVDYGTDGGGSDDMLSYDFADDSAYPTTEEEEEPGSEAAAGEELVALSQQQEDDGPYGIVKKYQDDLVCNIQVDEGPSVCKGRFRRWYYDPEEEECKEFFFRGCSGNGNNFESKDQCERLCGNRYGKASWQLPDEKPFNGMESLPLIRLEEGQEYRPGVQSQVSEMDCQVSAWSEWSDCTATCGSGWITRDRRVLVPPTSGGRQCPRKMVRRRKCRRDPCDEGDRYWYQGSWRHVVSNDDIRPDN